MPSTICRAAAGALLAAGSIAALAQGFPSKPVRVVLPYASGGVDTTLRLVTARVERDSGASIVVENRPGGGGTPAALAVKQAAPDGYTLLFADQGPLAANVTLTRNLPYDPAKDFQPVTLLWYFSPILMVSPNVQARTVKELAALARDKPGGLSYASPATGTSPHLLGSMFEKAVGTAMTHVPYKGAGPARVDLLAGRVDFFFVNYLAVKGDVLAGKIRPLAVASLSRTAALPNVPTMAEAGFPGVELDTWFGLVAPTGTAPPLVRRLHEMFARAVSSPEVTETLADQGFTVRTGPPEEFSAYIRSEITKMAVVIKQAGAVAD
jgi:tripartite-type tricarboxylate transporter receptor subunit TctC